MAVQARRSSPSRLDLDRPARRARRHPTGQRRNRRRVGRERPAPLDAAVRRRRSSTAPSDLGGRLVLAGTASASAPWPTWGSITTVGSTSAPAPVEAEALEGGAGDDDRPAGGNLAEARADVAPQLDETRDPAAARRAAPASRRARWRRGAPGPSSSSARPTRASRTSARAGTAAITSPSDGRARTGRSFAECTASVGPPVEHAPARPRFVNTPWPPSAAIGTSRRGRPASRRRRARSLDALRRRPRRAASRRRARPGASASGLPRVASRIARPLAGAQRSNRLRSASARRSPRASPPPP